MSVELSDVLYFSGIWEESVSRTCSLKAVIQPFTTSEARDPEVPPISRAEVQQSLH